MSEEGRSRRTLPARRARQQAADSAAEAAEPPPEAIEEDEEDGAGGGPAILAVVPASGGSAGGDAADRIREVVEDHARRGAELAALQAELQRVERLAQARPPATDDPPRTGSEAGACMLG